MFAGYLHYKKLTSLRNDTRGRKNFSQYQYFHPDFDRRYPFGNEILFRVGLTTADKDFHLSPYRKFIIAPSPPPVKTLFHKKL